MRAAIQTSTRVGFVALIALAIALAIGCGPPPKPPERGVLERNIESWNFRRYQKLLDVEIWVAKNRAVGHTASYVHNQAEKEGRVRADDVVNAFVTRYRQHGGVLRALVKFARRLGQEGGYVVDEDNLGGVQLITVNGNGETWVLWTSRRHIVKVGGRGIDAIPEDVIEAYGERYPSVIAEGVLDGPLPPGPDFEQPGEGGEDYDPDDPRPDWEDYDADKADMPGQTKPKTKPKSKPKTKPKQDDGENKAGAANKK